MKKVTLFKSAVLALLACVGIAACNNDATEVPTEPEAYTVKLGWAGEILDVSYEPLTRATTDDLYGIQVYSMPKTSSTPIWTPYAYGLFDDPNNITATLASGYKYKFIATMVKDGKNRIYIHKENEGDSEGYYQAPFFVKLGNQLYCDDESYFLFDDGLSSLIEDGGFRNYIRPNIERFYGELSDYIPGEDNTNAQIDMKRTSFGAKFIAGGNLAIDGKLEIEIHGAPKMELALTAGADEISDIFTFEKVRSAWSENDYTEDIAVNFKWIRADGTEAPLGTHTIAFKRNVTTVVKVNIEKNDNDDNLSYDISLGFKFDESETGVMPDGDEVTITNGQME